VAAAAAAFDVPLDRRLLFELRRMRRFDAQWFDAAYAYALAIGIGVVIEQQPERIGITA
jgi:hypothetical protein